MVLQSISSDWCVLLHEVHPRMENRKSKCQLDFSRHWDFSDVVLLVEGIRFHAHRSILAMWSPVFSRMFTADFKEKTAQTLPLPEKKASEIREMLLVIYPTSAKQIDESNYYFLLNLADEYMMKSLVEKCEEYLINCLKWPRQSCLLCLDLLDIAQKYKLEKLQMVCIDKARNLSFWKLKEDSMYSKISLSNFQLIVEGMIQQLESEIQQLRRELGAVYGEVRKLPNWVYKPRIYSCTCCQSQSQRLQGSSIWRLHQDWIPWWKIEFYF